MIFLHAGRKIKISDFCKCSPHQVWATWEEIRPGFYVEGDKEENQQPNETHPPICELICFEGNTSFDIEKLLELTAKILSSSLGIPNNIFITLFNKKFKRLN